MEENDKYYYKYKKYKQKYINVSLDVKDLKKKYKKIKNEYDKMLYQIRLYNNINYAIKNNNDKIKDPLVIPNII